MATYKLNVTFGYDDATTRTYSINIQEKVIQNSLATVKQKLAELRAAAKSEGSSVQKTFVSNNGKKTNNVTQATIVQTYEEVIY